MIDVICNFKLNKLKIEVKDENLLLTHENVIISTMTRKEVCTWRVIK